MFDSQFSFNFPKDGFTIKEKGNLVRSNIVAINWPNRKISVSAFRSSYFRIYWKTSKVKLHGNVRPAPGEESFEFAVAFQYTESPSTWMKRLIRSSIPSLLSMFCWEQSLNRSKSVLICNSFGMSSFALQQASQYRQSTQLSHQ